MGVDTIREGLQLLDAEYWFCSTQEKTEKQKTYYKGLRRMMELILPGTISRDAAGAHVATLTDGSTVYAMEV